MSSLRGLTMKTLTVKDKTIDLPIFMPDATKGVIRGLSSRQLVDAGVEGLIVNTFHLSNQPGATVLKQVGDIHDFMDWEGFVISDSGGFQLLSMVYKNPALGNISSKGISFSGSVSGKNRKYMFTPEKSIQTQFRIGSEVMICLDDCPRQGCSQQENKESVERTIEWAARCKEEFNSQIDFREIPKDERPLLFGVIQGGDDGELRKYCAAKLQEIGFDGYGFGGWPLTGEDELNYSILKLTADLMPDDKPKYALGVGSPEYLVECYKMGYSIFDCVLPTRDGRHGRLYVLNPNVNKENVLEESESVTAHMYIREERYVRDSRAIDPACDCYACKHYTRSYLHHLFQIEDTLGADLATIHNLRTYTRLIDLLREVYDGRRKV